MFIGIADVAIFASEEGVRVIAADLGDPDDGEA